MGYRKPGRGSCKALKEKEGRESLEEKNEVRWHSVGYLYLTSSLVAKLEKNKCMGENIEKLNILQ